MKKSIFLIVAAALALGVCAEPVSRDMAVAAANAWVLRNDKFGAGRVATGDVITVCDTNKAQTVLWHQVAMAGDGCVIVAPVTEIEPVVVALDNNPGELPAMHPLRGILAADIRKRLRFLGLYEEDPAGATLQGVAPAPPPDDDRAAVAAEWADRQKAKWARLGIGDAAALQASVKVGRDVVEMEVCVVKGFEKGGPLTHWNQGNGGGGYCYNLYTPNHCVCGCVATACSAIVQFFGAEESVEGYRGSCTYNGRPAEFYEWFEFKPARTKGGELDWSLFAGNTTRGSYDRLSEEQRELLGRVAFDAAVGVDMGWSDEGSGAMEAKIADALKDVFGFKNARYVGLNGPNPGETNLRKLIYGQCAAGAPVGMGIEGHSVVAVGYGQDSDGVERVRVFMGWGGSGDGWYALPYVDTKATMGGSSYLSEIVDGVVTMISYDDDDIVPVVGQATAGGFTVSFPRVIDPKDVPVDAVETNEETGVVTTNTVLVRQFGPREVMTDDNGWFATRVPPVTGTYSFFCIGKEGEYTVGPDCYASTIAQRLSASTPDWIVPFPLLNSSVALSFAKAIKLALAENKAILYVSGRSGETNTQCVLNHIFQLDDENTNDFTNRFVYLFATAATKNGDMCPSYAVVLPQGAEPDERWFVQNGRLSYGYGRNVKLDEEFTVTNVVQTLEIEDLADGSLVTNTVTTTNIVTAVGTNRLVSTYAPTGAQPVYDEFASWPVFADEAYGIYAKSVDDVIAQGWLEYAKKSSDIALTVVSEDGTNSGTPIPGWGTTMDVYTNGQTIVATSALAVTNETAGIVVGCGGYVLDLTNTVSGATSTVTGEENEVEITLAAGDHYTLTWLTETKFVYVSVDVSPSRTDPSQQPGTVEPASGWYPVGEQVVFTAKPADRWVFQSWNGAGPSGRPEESAVGGPAFAVTPTEPVSLLASFYQKQSADKIAETQTYRLAVASYELVFDETGNDIIDLAEIADPAFKPPVTVHGGGATVDGTTFVNGSTNAVKGIALGLHAPEPYVTTNRVGGLLVIRTWECEVWNVYDLEAGELPAHEAGCIGALAKAESLALEGDEGALAGYKPAQDAKLVLYWALVDEESVAVTAELAVAWNDDLDNLQTGDFELLSAEEAEEMGVSPATTVTVDGPPLGWKLDGGVKFREDGSVYVTLVMDEAALQPQPAAGGGTPLTIESAGDGKLTVKAEIANGVRGFWYSLFSAESPAGPWEVVRADYESGTPVKQAVFEEASGAFTLAITVDPTASKRFFKLVVTEKDPSAE